MNKIDSLINNAMSRGLFPGCAIALCNGDEEYLECMGTLRPVGQGPLACVSRSSTYDIASLTKVLVFLGVLRLVELRQIELDGPLVAHLPFRGGGDMNLMSFRHLLTCGLDFVLPQDLEKEGIHLRNAEGELRFFEEARLRAPLGEMFRYGNPSAFIAGKILENFTGLALDDALYTLVLDHLGMQGTRFNVDAGRLQRTAPTQVIGTKSWRAGVVQDPMSQAFSPQHVGIAGLFSGIEDMAKLARFLATGSTYHGKRFVSEELWKEMTKDQLEGKCFPEGVIHRYGLGIDKPSAGYVDDPLFCMNAVFMSARSGCFLFACPAWKRYGLVERPISGAILCNTDWSMPNAQNVHRNFRRAFVQEVLDGIKK